MDQFLKRINLLLDRGVQNHEKALAELLALSADPSDKISAQ
jgi:hypothetical protein